ncbi:MAG TPA: GNAT family N-acetyltransferase [Pyrinomonadaceae bacterium]|jgi:predicted GNAT superfamily acetyltransferase|nr:GNAT family N-acetyltransferase [Pyrinomonadaceae bacterium]
MEETIIRECTTIDELDNCVALQKEAFGLPDLEISPRRHLIVSRQAGGWTLGAFVADRMVGFVHHLVAVTSNDEIFGYSHMMAVAKDYQNKGVGARLKWAQRERAIAEGRRYIKWTWDPMQARNAHFNLNRLGVTVDTFGDNFYGTDYNADPAQSIDKRPGLQSDRLFGDWHLTSPRVEALSRGDMFKTNAKPVAAIGIPDQWSLLIRSNVEKARAEQQRVRTEFKVAFKNGLVCAGFERGEEQSSYLLFERNEV